MLKKIEQLLLRKPTNILGIDISSSSIKLAEVSLKKGRPLLRNIAVSELMPGIVAEGKIVDVQAATEVLRKLISTSGITYRDTITAVDGQAIFIREVPFPNMEETEMREAIKWDMENYVPYPPDSYYYDFAVVGPGKNEQEVKVLVVAAQHAIIDPLVEVMRNAGLRPLAIDIEPLALYRTLPEPENSLVIDIGAKMTQLVIFQNSSPTVTRTLPIGGQRFDEIIMNVLGLESSEAESLKQRQNNLLQRLDSHSDFTEVHRQMNLLVEELAREIRRTVEYYQMQNREATIDNFYLAGGSANIDNLAYNLSELLALTVTVHNPLDFVEVASSFDSNYLNTIAPRLAVAIGLGLRGGDL